jgi:hypothetical protein
MIFFLMTASSAALHLIFGQEIFSQSRKARKGKANHKFNLGVLASPPKADRFRLIQIRQTQYT